MSDDGARLPALLAGVRLLVFDADDTLRRTTVPGRPCPYADGEWELLPNVRETLAQVDWARAGIHIGIASNQDHVGYGHVAHTTAERLLRETVVAATAGQVTEPLVRLCPHRIEDRCACRKPRPGMLLDLLRTTGTPREAALFVGNAECDREAAATAGVRFAWAGEMFGGAG